MTNALKNALISSLIALGALAVIAIATWLTGGGDKVIGWIRRPAIEIKASSTSRGEVPTFLAGGPIRFTLKGTTPDKGLWDFDENEFKPGNVQIEHAFPYEAGNPQGIGSTRRIDVFFRVGAEYQTASTHVDVANVQLVSAKVQGKAISLSLNQGEISNWLLCQVSLGRFEEGAFKAKAAPHEGACSTTPSVIVDQSMLEKLGVTFGRTYNPESVRDLIADVSLVSPDGTRSLETVQSLDSQVKQLMAAAALR